MVKYPEVNIRLVGEDGNAFSIIVRVIEALRKAGVDPRERDAFHTEATAGDYDNLLRTVMAWVTCDENDDEDTVFSVYGCQDCGEMYAVGGCPACGGEGV